METKIESSEESILLEESNTALAEQLLAAVQKNDLTVITNILTVHKHLLTYEYKTFDYHTILTLACNDRFCMDQVTGQTIKALIDLGAQVNKHSRMDQWGALHYTAVNANFVKMEALVEYLSENELNSLVCCKNRTLNMYPFLDNKQQETYSNNALSILLKYGMNQKDFLKCLQLLRKSGVNLHQSDSLGVTPADLIWKLGIKDFSLPKKSAINSQGILSSCFDTVRVNRFKDFLSMKITIREANSLDGPNEDLSSCTLMQLCCSKGNIDCVQHLLNGGASPNKTIEKNPDHPIMIAIDRDYEQIVHLLLKRIDLNLPSDILLRMQSFHSNSKRTFAKYMNLILNHLKSKSKEEVERFLSIKDAIGYSVLHYAIYSKSTDTTLALLNLGASLMDKDISGVTPLQIIEPEVLKQFFDKCVMERDSKSNAIYRVQRSYVKINFQQLIATEEESESLFLWHMIQKPSLNPLLSHPVVVSFLALKWNKFKWAVYLNLSLYLSAYILLIFYECFYAGYSKKSSNTLLTVASALLLSREIMQILIFKWKYLKRIENIFGFSLIGAIVYIILASWIPTLNNQNMLVAYSVVFLTSTLGIFMQLGNLSFFTVKVIMFKQITINFLRYMTFYMFPILAFCFCFYKLEETKTNNNSFFNELHKTLVMFSGDADEEFPDHFTTNPIFGHVIYIIFVALIQNVLHNLLIGLAVSDLQEIRKEAEFVCKKEQSKYITTIEKIVFNGSKYSTFFKNLFGKVLHFLKVFKKDKLLVIISDGKNISIKTKGSVIKKIGDNEVIKYVQHLFENLTFKEKTDNCEDYLRDLYEKLEKLEALILEKNTKISNQSENTVQ